MQEESPKIQTSPWCLDSFIDHPRSQQTHDLSISSKQMRSFDPNFYQQLSLARNNYSLSQTQDQDISPIQIGLINKSTSVFENDDEQNQSPLIPFQPFPHLIRFNSEIIHNFENDNSRSVNFGDNKYVKQKQMTIEQFGDHKNKTPPTPTTFKDRNQFTLKKQLRKIPRNIVNYLDHGIRKNYEPIKLIGQGKIGKVYQVKSKIDGLFYAIKKIELTEFDNFSKAIFRQDIQFLAELVDEVHLVRFHDSQVHNDHLYIIMEHCGHSLHHTLSNHIRMYETQLRQILQDICQILDVLQCKFQKAHLNIHPSNILLSKNKIYKLGDFGLQNLSQGDQRWDKEIKYCAPEEYDHKAYNDKADVYSLGVILYELMIERILPKTQRLSNPKLDILNHYSQSLKSLVKRMVNFDPKLRPSLKEILKTLKLDLDEELLLIIRENNEMQKQITQLQPNNGTHKKNLSF